MRKVSRVLFVLAFVAAVVAAVIAARLLGFEEGATWTTIAAALAVTVALITAWNGQRLFELQEDSRQPYPYPFIDVTSRYSLMQLRVTNYGGGVARDIRLEWTKALLDAEGQQIQFTEQQGAPDIAVLLPDQSIAVLVGTYIKMYGRYEDMNYSGIIRFKNASGRRLEHHFYVSAEQYRNTLTHGEEELKTHYQLQKIPEELKRLNRQLKRFRRE